MDGNLSMSWLLQAKAAKDAEAAKQAVAKLQAATRVEPRLMSDFTLGRRDRGKPRKPRRCCKCYKASLAVRLPGVHM